LRSSAEHVSASARAGRADHAAGIFLLSAATLLLELSLTRGLSVSQWYHFGILVISTALLGFGADAGRSLLPGRARCQHIHRASFHF